MTKRKLPIGGPNVVERYALDRKIRQRRRQKLEDAETLLADFLRDNPEDPDVLRIRAGIFDGKITLAGLAEELIDKRHSHWLRFDRFAELRTEAEEREAEG